MSSSPPPSSFARLLRSAVSASDLTLAELAGRLAACGHPVSRSTLSAWQSGRTLPTRRSGRAALPALERLLDLEPGALTAPVGPRTLPDGVLLQPEVRPRWARSAAARNLMSQLGTHPEDPARPLQHSLRFRVHVDGEGRQEAMHFSMLLRGGPASSERLVRLVRLEQLPSLPTLALLYGATLGRVRARPSLGLVAFELLLDQPLGPGEETLVEYLLPLPAPTPTQWIRTEASRGLRELVLQAVFTPGHHPEQVRATNQAAEEGEVGSRVLEGAEGSYQVALLDPVAGGYGMEWSWAS
jgi:transcriptional regulator with XRE-family HTH domain